MNVVRKKPDGIANLKRGHPLAQRLLFYAHCGEQRGHVPTSKNTWIDHISRNVAHIDGSVSGTTGFELPGWSSNSGSSLDIQEIDDIGTLWDFSGDAMSVAVLVKIEDDPDNAAAFCKRTGLGNTDTGWSITAVQSSNDWKFDLSDGSSEESLTFGSFNVSAPEWQLLVVTLSASKACKGYVDGVLGGSATLAHGGQDGNSNNSIKILGDDNGPNDQIDAHVSMAAIWDRELNPQEVQMLAADPFVITRHQLTPEGDLGGLVSSDEDYFLCF